MNARALRPARVILDAVRWSLAAAAAASLILDDSAGALRASRADPAPSPAGLAILDPAA